MVWRRPETGDRSEIGERQRIFSTVGEHSVLPFLYLFAVSDTVLLHIRLSPRRGRHDSAAQFFCALCRKAPAKINCTECLIRRCRALQRAKELRDTVMSRLRRLSGLCSRILSDPANRLRKTRKKKSSAVPLFRSGHMSAICARLSKGKGEIHKRVETAGVYPLVPPPGRRTPR